MASPKYKTGDTWPPLSGTVTDDDGPVDISSADEVRVIISDPEDMMPGWSGTVIVDDDGTVPNRGRWHVLPEADTFTVACDPEVEIEVTWDDTTSPPQIETYPDDEAFNPTIHVTSDLD